MRNEVVGRNRRGRTNQISRAPSPTSPLTLKNEKKMPRGKKWSVVSGRWSAVGGQVVGGQVVDGRPLTTSCFGIIRA